jgi:alpha-L-fucosidase
MYNIEKKINKILGLKNNKIVSDNEFLDILFKKELIDNIGWISHDKETRKLISEKTKEAMKGMGSYLSKKAKEDIAKSPERLKRLRRMASRPGELNGMYGKNHSKETLEKISNSKKGHIAFTYKWKITTPDGELIIRNNLHEYCRNNKLSMGNLTYHGHTKGFKAVRV